jgi:hypothetical protein
MKLKVKIIMGYRKDQEHTIDIEEAHKAYHLFMNPEKRAIFSDGLAIKGKDIEAIVPDYHATMGWNKSHTLDAYDFEELKEKGIDSKIRELLYEAKQIAVNVKDEKLFLKPLSEVKQLLLE